ncbi:hypothetical protein K505DRAFT_99758 [Melanomma pulvis-pyrius CBS 109.77]|uniref:Uncharacterized protein n=1 Tax=Melanomma pulvis-pyrius CBS 109.77 TaxID=1314802 RepID=A0A6A6WY55_9PLEO|nr:hypothetical protein K505DRAFT_99758 [Melanomma pulvis-pyrius CBS 109.77]
MQPHWSEDPGFAPPSGPLPESFVRQIPATSNMQALPPMEPARIYPSSPPFQHYSEAPPPYQRYSTAFPSYQALPPPYYPKTPSPSYETYSAASQPSQPYPEESQPMKRTSRLLSGPAEGYYGASQRCQTYRPESRPYQTYAAESQPIQRTSGVFRTSQRYFRASQPSQTYPVASPPYQPYPAASPPWQRSYRPWQGPMTARAASRALQRNSKPSQTPQKKASPRQQPWPEESPRPAYLPWTPAEEGRVSDLQAQGHSWGAIGEMVEGRSSSASQYRYNQQHLNLYGDHEVRPTWGNTRKGQQHSSAARRRREADRARELEARIERRAAKRAQKLKPVALPSSRREACKHTLGFTVYVMHADEILQPRRRGLATSLGTFIIEGREKGSDCRGGERGLGKVVEEGLVWWRKRAW